MKIVSLGEIATIDRKAVKPEDIADGTTYVGLENIVSGGEFLSVGPVANGELASAKLAFDERHILYGKLRPYLAKIAVPSFGGVCSTDILPVRVGSAADKMFVAHFLRQRHVVDQVNGLAAGANLPRISPSALLTIQIPLPPLDEQRRIAAILDKADDLRTKRREALAHLDTLTQSIFHSMFGEGRRNPLAWPTSELDTLLEFGPQNGMYLPASEYGSGAPIVRIDSFRGGIIDDLSSLKRLRVSTNDLDNYGLQTGDILINRVNSIEHLGKSCVVPDLREPTVFESNMMRCRFDRNKVHSEYLRSALMSDYMYGQIVRRAKRAVNQASINQTDVRQFEIRVPPLELQQAFANRVAAVERLKELHRKHLAELDTLFASLQHRAFKGEL